jgi:hypothetical protein
MKLSTLALATILSAGTATAASAVNFDFSFSDDGSLGPFDVPGTVTGEILGLTNNATSTATHVVIESVVNPEGESLGLATPLDTIGKVITNTFTIAGGQITAASYAAIDTSSDGYELLLDFNGRNSLYSGGTNLITGNTGGVTGITFTLAGPVPETPTWVMLVVGFVGLGIAGHSGMRKNVGVAA